MSPAHQAGKRRWLVLTLVAAVLAGLAVAARSPGSASPGGPPPESAAAVSAPDAESSAWYCTGQSTAAGQLAPGSVILTNTGSRSVSGTIDAVTDTGAKVEVGVSVPARSQRIAAIPVPKTGAWISEAITLSGGGVAVTQATAGPSGWSESPCQSSTSRQWYFPSGVTTGSDALFVALFNPTSTPDVVDLGFVTPAGPMHPINFQGIVLEPGQMQVESVAPFVQDKSSVSTTVVTRTGRLVASELQLLSGDGSGLSIVPGSPRPEEEWTIPQSTEVAGGSSSIDVFNPGPTTEDVKVRIRLGSGPVAPFVARVSPGSTWVLPTSLQTRIPQGDPYSTEIAASGEPGVVVGRIVIAPTTSQAPQGGLSTAVDGLTSASPTLRWVVPSLGSSTQSAIPVASPNTLALTNLSAGPETYVIDVMGPSGLRTLATGTIGVSASLWLGSPVLSLAGLSPLIVGSSGQAAVSEDVGPTGTLGVVTMPGLPLSAALGS
ncbi:MAG: DUF5719 family protein [Acidimicrobiales bacterium]